MTNMDNEFFLNLDIGDEVFWNDPDKGILSGYYKISEILSNDVVLLINDVGSTVEVFKHELS